MGTNNGRLSRRDLLVKAAAGAAGSFALAEFLASCGSSSTTASSNATLAYWDFWVSQAPWVDNEIKLFQAAHPSIKVTKTTQGNNTYENLISLAKRSGNLPDVFIVPQSIPTADVVSQGWLLPLDKYADSSFKSRFPDGTFHEGSNVFNGKLYSAPLYGNAAVLQIYVNLDVFKNAGLVDSSGNVILPQTWDDITHAAETITQKGNGNTYGLGFGNSGGGILGWWLDTFARGAGSPGGTIGSYGGLDYRTGKHAFSSDRNYADFIALFLDWKKKGYFYPNSVAVGDEAARVLFTQGKFGMTIGGVWNQGGWQKQNFTNYNLTVLPAPSASTKGYYYSSPGGTNFVISAKTKTPDQAWAWFDWLYSVDAGKRWVASGQAVSAITAANDPSLNTFKPFATYVGTAKDNISGPDPTIRNPQTSGVAFAEPKPGVDDVMTGLFTGQLTDVQGALKDLDSHYDQALADAISAATAKGAKVSQSDFVFSDWDPTKPYITKSQS